MGFNIVEVDGGKIRLIDIDGSSIGVSDNPIKVDPTGSTIQPISVTSLPLPNGATEQSTLATIRDKAISISEEDFATQSTLATIRDKAISISEEDFATQSTLETIRSQTNKLQFDNENYLKTNDVLNGGGVNGSIIVGSSVAVEAIVGSSTLTNRKALVIEQASNQTLYWGFSSGVTISNGISIDKKQQISMEIGPNTHVWLIANADGQSARIAEFA